MAGSRGYYSLIQYCPDRSRLEVANVGVLLFCPEMRFFRPLMSKGNDRIRKLFSAQGEELTRIELAKKAIEERIAYEETRQPDLDDVNSFIRTRANDMIVTPLRPMKVDDPERDLARLYTELVGGRERRVRSENVTAIPELDQAMRSDLIKDKVRRSLKVELPIIGRQITYPYAFLNGKLNYIQPERFSHTQSETLRKAEDIAMAGSLLFTHPDENGTERSLIVVSSFVNGSLAVLPAVEKLLGEYHVRLYTESRLDDLVAEIQHSAH
jgi:hypothetical protein